MTAQSYKTHTGLLLTFRDENGHYRVTLRGDREKLLYAGDDERDARRMYKEVKAHYEQRRREEMNDAS